MFPLSQLEGKDQRVVTVKPLDPKCLATIESQHPEELTDDQQDILTVTLGTRIQNEIYRHILVSVFSEHWVEYLTKVDALRVSIGMEAFAQRDPLVQYKSEAAGMFKQLLSDIRAGVISKMFLFQPRAIRSCCGKDNIPTEQVRCRSGYTITSTASNKKKRKRH